MTRDLRRRHNLGVGELNCSTLGEYSMHRWKHAFVLIAIIGLCGQAAAANWSADYSTSLAQAKENKRGQEARKKLAAVLVHALSRKDASEKNLDEAERQQRMEKLKNNVVYKVIGERITFSKKGTSRNLDSVVNLVWPLTHIFYKHVLPKASK